MDPLEALRQEMYPAESTLVLPVQDPLSAYYVVTCDQPPPDPWEAVDQLLATVTPLELLDELRWTIDTSSALAVSTAEQAPPIPWDWFGCWGGDPAQLRQARAAPHQILVRGDGRPGRPPTHIWAALAVARALQVHTRGVLADVQICRLVPPGDRGSRGERSLQRGRRERVSTWVYAACSPEPDGSMWMSTTGLVRFGLPELSMHDIGPTQIRGALQLVMTVAHLLVAQQAGAIGHLPGTPALRAVPHTWSVTDQDRQAAYPEGDDPAFCADPTVVRLVETANDVRGGHSMLEMVLC